MLINPFRRINYARFCSYAKVFASSIALFSDILIKTMQRSEGDKDGRF
jgi:hypothetical protein